MRLDRPPTPTCYTLLPCDTAIQDKNSHKYTLVGVFSSVMAMEFPATTPRVSIYFCLSGAHGRYVIKLQLKDPASGEYLLPENQGLTLDVPDPDAVVEQSLTVVNMAFVAPGRYDLILLANDEEIGQQSIWVRQVQVEQS